MILCAGDGHNNEYCFIFKFRDERICELIEYGDTDLVERVLSYVLQGVLK